MLLPFLACIPRAVLAQPANDDCANAQSLIVHALADCPGTAVAGNNVAATGTTSPACDSTATFFKDVWYSFNSGPNTEVLVDFTFVTIDEWGIEVLDACGGTSVFCDSTALEYTVPVISGTVYWLRVWTNADLGSGGVFTICLSGDGVVPLCDGATVLSDFGTADLDVCSDGFADVVDFGSSTGSPESYAFLLTDTNNVLIAVVVPPVDFDTMALGNYRVYGVSFNGDLVGNVPGTSLDSISSNGQCFDLSDNSVAVSVDICNGVERNDPHVSLSISPNPSKGNFRVRCSQRMEDVYLRLSDITGRNVYATRLGSVGAEGHEVRLEGSVAAGTYVLSLYAATWERSTRVVLE